MTSYDDLNAVLRVLVTGVRQALGGTFIGAYLQGSFALAISTSTATSTYARMLHDLVAGRPGSKRAGAEWAKATFGPEWVDLIDSAWGGRPNPAMSVRTPASAQAFAQTLDFLRLVMAEAERA